MKRTVIGGFIMIGGLFTTLTIILMAMMYMPSMTSWTGSQLWYAIFGEKQYHGFGHEAVQNLFLVSICCRIVVNDFGADNTSNGEFRQVLFKVSFSLTGCFSSTVDSVKSAVFMGENFSIVNPHSPDATQVQKKKPLPDQLPVRGFLFYKDFNRIYLISGILLFCLLLQT